MAKKKRLLPTESYGMSIGDSRIQDPSPTGRKQRESSLDDAAYMKKQVADTNAILQRRGQQIIDIAAQEFLKRNKKK